MNLRDFFQELASSNQEVEIYYTEENREQEFGFEINNIDFKEVYNKTDLDELLDKIDINKILTKFCKKKLLKSLIRAQQKAPHYQRVTNTKL